MRRKQAGSTINTDGWMMSYADMATILLAMFIVLSTLSKDQTGISLYNGAGSFVQALGSFGLPGISVTSQRPILNNYSTPRYLFDPVKDARDEDEEDSLQRFLQELHRQFAVERLRPRTGQVVIDLYEPLHREPPYLAAHHTETLAQIRPLLDRSNYRVNLVVWTPTPHPSAWSRAAGQARRAADEFLAAAHLPPDAAAHLIPVAQPWRYRDIRRPILSLVVAKVEE